MKEDINKKPKKTVKTGRFHLESEPEKEKRPSKIIRIDLMKETTQKDWITSRMKSEKGKPCSDNTLAYDLTNAPPKIEKTQKRKIISPGKNKIERKGKKIMPEKIRESERNTLAFH